MYWNADPKPEKTPKKPKGFRKATGELELFKRIYEDRAMKCCITDEHIEFDVNCFMHVLSKGAFPSYRLLEWNILMVKRRVHHLYDNEGRDKLLAEFPKAIVIYELKDFLKSKYGSYAQQMKFNKGSV